MSPTITCPVITTDTRLRAVITQHLSKTTPFKNSHIQPLPYLLPPTPHKSVNITFGNKSTDVSNIPNSRIRVAEAVHPRHRFRWLQPTPVDLDEAHSIRPSNHPANVLTYICQLWYAMLGELIV